MTRKDFEKIAEILAEARNAASESQPDQDRFGANPAIVDEMIELFAKRLKSTNPRFNADRFIEACKG